MNPMVAMNSKFQVVSSSQQEKNIKIWDFGTCECIQTIHMQDIDCTSYLVIISHAVAISNNRFLIVREVNREHKINFDICLLS